MRPLKLTLEGFGSFYDKTVVDFTDVELAALIGANRIRQINDYRCDYNLHYTDASLAIPKMQLRRLLTKQNKRLLSVWNLSHSTNRI